VGGQVFTGFCGRAANHENGRKIMHAKFTA